MEIQFWGAAQTVTGSMHLLKVNGQKIMLDCGLFQGRRKEAFERNRNFPFDPAEIDALIVSHAHTDHIGNIPTLVRQGFNGPIYATPATRDLCEFMLKDSAHIQQNDVEYVNKKSIREGKVPFEPLYTLDDVWRTLSLFEEVNYQRPFTPVKDVQRASQPTQSEWVAANTYNQKADQPALVQAANQRYMGAVETAEGAAGRGVERAKMGLAEREAQRES